MALYVQGYKIKDFKRDYPYLNITKKDIKDIFLFCKLQAEGFRWAIRKGKTSSRYYGDLGKKEWREGFTRL